jgi:hypothetical protein
MSEPLEELEVTRARIHRAANAHAEATVYSMNNPYLTASEKAQVEAVYQFPIGIFTYPFVVNAVAFDQTFWVAYLNASFVAFLAWCAARWLPGRPFFYIAFLYAGWVGTLIQLGFAGWAALEGRYWVAGFAALSAIGIASFLTIGMWLWSFSYRRINPKYAIAKRLFGIEFPFEKDLA